MIRVILLITVALISLSCDKEAKRLYKMAGVYNISEIKQLQYVNGVLTSEETYQNVGILDLEYPQTTTAVSFYGTLYIEDETVPIIAFQELGGKKVFSWDVSQDDKRMSLVWTDFYSEYGLTFTITKNKKKSKELFFVYTETDTSDNLIEYMEFYTLEPYQ